MLTEDAKIITKARYHMEGEDWMGNSHRCGHHLALPERDYKAHVDKFTEVIYNLKFIPAGRILRNCGRPKGSLLNCYHIPIGDSIEEIGQHTKDSLTLWSEGGGTGTNYSTLRPRGDRIVGKGGNSSGLVSFLRANNGFAGTIKSGGSRRAAGLANVIVYHPEVVDVIKAKVVDGELSNYNISVDVVDEFIEAVRFDQDWTFKFAERDYETMPAREIWDLIITNMIKSGEPGLLNWNNLQKNNSYYCAPISGTNPCGEAPLEAFGACDLGSLVLPNFIANKNTKWLELEETIHTAVRMLDNVLDINKYSMGRVKRNCLGIRRIGLGTMGLADYLFQKEVRYGSEESLYEIEKLYKFIRNVSYEASVKLAQEKGAFPKYESIPYNKASFIRKLPANLRSSIRHHGIRNCTLLAMAPTGTISMIAGCSSGVEPVFAKAYKREDEISTRVYVHPKYHSFLKDKKLEVPDWFVDSYDVTPREHLEVQAMIQKYTDGAVSKTINLPNDYTAEKLSPLLLEYIQDVKGVTVYRDGSRDGQVLTKLTKPEIKKHLNENTMAEEDVSCPTGACTI